MTPEELRALRKSKQLTVKAAGELCGMTDMGYRAYEDGKRKCVLPIIINAITAYEPPPIEGDDNTPDTFSLDDWQDYASPVWMDIDQQDVLTNYREAREHDDERHICPLQLGVIERALKLWSAKDDLVFSPFTGIGSEGFQSLKMGRRFVGAELKRSYFDQAVNNLTRAEAPDPQMSLLGDT